MTLEKRDPANFPAISEEVLSITKMVEKVGLANFFHDLGLQNGLSRGKCWPGQLFPLFPRIVEEVFGIIKMVEKVVKTNFFYDLGLQNGLSR